MKRPPSISDAIASLNPTADWILRGTDYSGLEWLDSNFTKPTQAEVEAELVRLIEQHNNLEYQRLRALEYPSIGDQLDALWKGGDIAAEMLVRVQAVKDRYPKPGSV
jgi:hypothetical protein